MRKQIVLIAIVTLIVCASGFAQVPAPPREQPLPDFFAYWPEREATARLRRLIRNALLEAHINYHVESGDVSAFLRYKYYATNFTYRLTVFDALSFPDTGRESTIDYERVRGAALLVTIPRNYSNRFLWLLEGDALTFGDVSDPDSNRKDTNVYTKIGYQFGTPFDERLNAVAGEARASMHPLLTGFREVSPEKNGVAAALSQTITSTYRYTKFEGEVLRRFDPSRRVMVFSRLHVGTFAGYREKEEPLPQVERYSVPRQELFSLGGRDALVSLPVDRFTLGLHEIHTRHELFVPILRNRDLRTGPLGWNTLYGVGYVGAGSVTFRTGDLFKSDELVVDAGLGFDTGLTIGSFDTYVSLIYSHTLQAPCVRDPETGARVAGERCLEGGTWAVSIRTTR
jgi:hypothetical protein